MPKAECSSPFVHSEKNPAQRDVLGPLAQPVSDKRFRLGSLVIELDRFGAIPAVRAVDRPSQHLQRRTQVFAGLHSDRNERRLDIRGRELSFPE